jgi:p-cumate 2,3-dioxygenase alpha subunit
MSVLRAGDDAMNEAVALQRGRNASGYVEEIPERNIFRVRRTAFVEESVLEREKRAIFDKCWLYLGHESELPNPCDFLTRSVGGRELVFNRDRAGKFHVFFNSCPHRGAMLVREPKGNALSFQCFYHGWAFNVNGRFASRFSEGNYGTDHYEGGCANLTHVPRFEQYRGFFFVNFSAQGETLESYLAGAKDMIDLISDQGELGMEIVGGEQQYVIKANWKLLSENSADGFHAQQTHSTYLDYLANIGNLPTDPAQLKQVMAARDPNEGRGIDLGNGHAMIEYPAAWGRPAARWAPAWGEETRELFQRKRARLIELYGRDRGDRMARLNRNIVIFPNLALNDIMSLTVRTFFPESPSRMAVSSWALGVRDEPPLAREIRLNNFVEFLGPGGLATPDDVEAIESCQRGYHNLREVPWNDISKGMPRGKDAQHEDEEQMRCFWREWDRRMAADAE